jgi:hypothetical protein
MTENDQIRLNVFATRCFRDVADQDYIAARSCYKHELGIQFNWMAEQAIEKYLKAILLYNAKTTLNLGHNLIKALEQIKTINGLNLDLSEDVLKYINSLDYLGPNRYLEKYYKFKGVDLILLDKSVWEIRRYCKFLNTNQKISEEIILNMAKNIEVIHRWKESPKPNEHKINFGYLEEILKKPNNIQFKSLIWKNLYFGIRSKKSISYRNSFKCINPPHLKCKEDFEFYKKYIKFPKDTEDQFKRSIKNKS